VYSVNCSNYRPLLLNKTEVYKTKVIFFAVQSINMISEICSNICCYQGINLNLDNLDQVVDMLIPVGLPIPRNFV
jgi:hypothetical protein